MFCYITNKDRYVCVSLGSWLFCSPAHCPPTCIGVHSVIMDTLFFAKCIFIKSFFRYPPVRHSVLSSYIFLLAHLLLFFFFSVQAWVLYQEQTILLTNCLCIYIISKFRMWIQMSKGYSHVFSMHKITKTYICPGVT